MNECRKIKYKFYDELKNTKHMQKITTYLMYFPRLYITCLTLLSKLSGREREVEHTVTIYKPHDFFNKL